MGWCYFVSDLHGDKSRYEKLFAALRTERPEALFIGGDLLPSGISVFSSLDFAHTDFLHSYLAANLSSLKQDLQDRYPRVFVILGNDDARSDEASILDLAGTSLLEYVHDRKVSFGCYTVYGYAYIPPTPFQLKDWERYDVSRYVDPDCTHPYEGLRTVPVSDYELRYSTIDRDLKQLVATDDLSSAIMLFHAPPYQTNLDQIKRTSRYFDSVPLDEHIGSIAIQRFIKARQPLLTLHGHAHESARLSGSWRDQLGRTACFSAAHDGSELSLIRFDPAGLNSARRDLV